MLLELQYSTATSLLRNATNHRIPILVVLSKIEKAKKLNECLYFI